MAEPTFCSGLADLASRYEGFIVDQWGVLHDGHGALSGRARLPAAAARRRQAGRAAQQLGQARRDQPRSACAEIGIDRRAVRRRGDLGRGDLAGARRADRSVLRRARPALHPVVARRRPLAGRGARTSRWCDDADDADFLLLGGIEDDARLEEFARRARAGGGARPADGLRQPGRRRGACRAAASAWRRARSPATTRAWAAGSSTSASRTARSTQLCLEALGTAAAGRRSWRSAIWSPTTSPAAPRMGLATALIMSGIHAPLVRSGPRPRAPIAAALERLEGRVRRRGRDWVLPRFRWR